MTTGQPPRAVHVTDSDFTAEGNVLRRAPRVREEEVHQTADALLLEGDRPTVERVRQRLGRGSPNTIALFLDRWWTQLGARLRDLPGQELPGVPPAVSASLVSLWSSAIDEARGLLKDTLASQAAEIEMRRNTVDEESAALEGARAVFARERAALEHTVSVVQNQLNMANDRHEADLLALRELRAEVSRLHEQRERQQGEVLELTARLETQAREHEESLRQVRERAEASEKHWIKQVDEVRLALGSERKRAELLDKGRQAELARSTSELAAQQGERQILQQALTNANEELAAARAELSKAKEAARLQQLRAEELAQQLESQAESVLTRDQFETHLRDAIARAFAVAGESNVNRRRVGSNEKPRK